MARNYWMFVATLENFEISKELGFTLHGVGGRYPRRAQRMQPNDRVLYYVETIRKWAATATIRSNFFEDRTPIWKSAGMRGDHFGYRVKLAPDVVLEEEDYIDAMILAPSLEYLKKWAPEIWPLAFQDRLHLLPQKDFRLIEAEMNRNVLGREGDQRTSASDSREVELSPRPPEPRIIEGVAPEVARYTEAEHGGLADASENPQRTDWSPREVGPPQVERGENEPHQPPDLMPEHQIESSAPGPNLTTSSQPGEGRGAQDASPPTDAKPEEEPGSSETYPATDGSSAGST